MSKYRQIPRPACKSCNNEKSKQRQREIYKTDRAKLQKISKNWKDSNKERIKEYDKAKRASNPEIHKNQAKQWKLKNKDRVAEYNKKYLSDNYIEMLAKSRKRHASKLNAVPAWMNPFFVEEIYDLARLRTKATGIKWHVDHIVPLQSKLVCGLHWEGNMQVIPAFVNIQKKNYYWPDMPDVCFVDEREL